MTEEIYNAEHIVKTFGHGKNQVQAVKDVSFGSGRDRSPASLAKAVQVSQLWPEWCLV
jgi:hypothetical protein